MPSDKQNNFNLLRLIFAILVILSHSPELIDGNRSRELLTQTFHTISFGELAVFGFFLLSGYLIVQSWLNRPEIIQFLRNRVLRIIPAFVVASLFCALVVGPIASDPGEYFSKFWLGGFIKNLVVLGLPTVPAVFKGTHYALVNGSMWTIPLEFQCYLLVLLIGVIGGIEKRYVWVMISMILVGALVGQQFLITHEKMFPLLELSAFFFVGGCFRLYREEIAFYRSAAVLIATLLFSSMFYVSVARIALAVGGGYLLFYFATTRISALDGFNRLPDVSYGTYLYAWPIQKLMLWYFPSMSPSFVFGLTTILSLIFGAASWYAIEKPFIALKNVKPFSRLSQLTSKRVLQITPEK